ncbi:MAG: energy-coupled thiamine transporter ThiT [Eubacterium sp.]|nr:energy-coupled thiamine transporter ThiT [Eubacterium sp.]MCM1214312.1 energy-coupled thiamine transporter ThiT [Lachnospiraceae bacterium]MCM1302541.1 energy-coupled thiamine transporter ThiT [Butyrivibrio sp.]MCM1342331.1 energy-coupled thiamine transporter ThiT [Muribaculaceae bacterium]MCM1238030.1 energy-coupled thiamine transporter ThiT [Lachnospiraceae bacterium]
MSDLFTFLNEDGEFQLTVPGIITVIVLILLLVAVAILLRSREKSTGKARIATKQLVFSGVAMALAMITSEIKFARLPFGGSVTLFSMLFIVLIGYWYGAKAGLLTGFAYGLLQFVINPVFYSPWQLLVDYPLAFGALGLSGFFSNQKNGLLTGYIVGVLGRYLFTALSGGIFFGAYAPTQTPLGILTYTLGYNASYIAPEAVITIIILAIPAVKNALVKVKELAAQ